MDAIRKSQNGVQEETLHAVIYYSINTLLEKKQTEKRSFSKSASWL